MSISSAGLLAPEYTAFIETDCCKFRVSVDVRLFPVSAVIDEPDEAEYRGHQILNLYRGAIEDETRRMEFANSLILKQQQQVQAMHSHCECRTKDCGHLDIRHRDGKCSFPGCKCTEWS